MNPNGAFRECECIWLRFETGKEIKWTCLKGPQ